jgi:uncharacterized protein (DUF433 family)
MKSDEQVKYEEFIHDRGPEVKGTRITVYAILDYLLVAWSPERIASWFRLTVPQVEAAIEYIRHYTLEVMRNYIKILERVERGNSPEVQAIIDANHEKFLQMAAKVRQLEETNPEIRKQKVHALIEEFRQSTTKVPFVLGIKPDHVIEEKSSGMLTER